MKEKLIAFLLKLLLTAGTIGGMYYFTTITDENAKLIVQTVGWILCVVLCMIVWGYFWPPKKEDAY